jgi:hypothetical protein
MLGDAPRGNIRVVKRWYKDRYLYYLERRRLGLFWIYQNCSYREDEMLKQGDDLAHGVNHPSEIIRTWGD